MSFTVQTQLKEERGKTKNSLGIWYSSFEQQQSKLLSLNLHRVEKSYQTDWIGKVWIWVENSKCWVTQKSHRKIRNPRIFSFPWIKLHWDLDKVEFRAFFSFLLRMRKSLLNRGLSVSRDFLKSKAIVE